MGKSTISMAIFNGELLVITRGYHVISCHIMSYHVISCHIMSYHVISCHIMSYHVISCHIMSYHVISIWGELTFHFFSRTFEGPFHCKSVPVRRCSSVFFSIWKGTIWGNTDRHHRFGAYNMAVLSWSVV